MRYLLITNDFYPNNIGGMTHYYTELARAFGKESLVVLTVAAEVPSDKPDPCTVVRTTVNNSGSGKFFGKRAMRKEAFRIVRDEKIDVLLCGNVRPYGDVAFDIHKTLGIPYYIFFHGNDLLRILTRMNRYILKRIAYGRMLDAAQGFIANSRYVMGLIPSQFTRNKNLIVLNPGVGKDFENLAVERPFREKDRVRLLTVGRLVPRKGVLQVIEALALLKDSYPGLTYDVVGGGDSSEYRKKAGSLGLGDRVIFHGFRSGDEVMEHFRSCDVFVMVSHASDKDNDVEGFGIVYLEANAFGKPVIGSASGGIPDAVEDGVTGRLVKDPFDPREIADAISWMCEHPDQAAAMGEAGRQRVNRSFTYPVLAERLKTKIRPEGKKSGKE